MKKLQAEKDYQEIWVKLAGLDLEGIEDVQGTRV